MQLLWAIGRILELIERWAWPIWVNGSKLANQFISIKVRGISPPRNRFTVRLWKKREKNLIIEKRSTKIQRVVVKNGKIP